MIKPTRNRLVMAIATGTLVLGALSPALTPLPVRAETAVAPERHPPGDIPDTQVFIDYKGAGYAVKVPEGWARSGDPKSVQFVDKLDGVAVDTSNMKTAPTASWAKSSYAKTLEANGRAVGDVKIKTLNRPAGKAIRISYRVNSEPNPVTSKQVRLEAQRYLFWKNGTLATLKLWAPAGADNVDQWKLMSESFQWQ